jgi:hypothetical protein
VFNSRNFCGTDGTLVLSDPVGLDTAVFTGYWGESGVVGRVVNVSIAVSTEVKPFYELGSRAAKELRAGNIAITGTVERAYLNGALLTLMLGQYATNEEAAGFTIPSFDMKLILDNLMPAGDEGNSVLTVYGVIFDSWQTALPEDDFMLEKLSFKARRIAITDTELKSA